MATHELKTWPGAFSDIWSGRKHAEFRRNDRPFRIGDDLLLREWCPASGYSGRSVTAEVTCITTGHGIPAGFVMLSITTKVAQDFSDTAAKGLERIQVRIASIEPIHKVRIGSIVQYEGAKWIVAGACGPSVLLQQYRLHVWLYAETEVAVIRRHEGARLSSRLLQHAIYSDAFPPYAPLPAQLRAIADILEAADG